MTEGERIAQLRTKLNLSQEDLANKLNVSRQAVYKWETGLAFPTRDNLIELAKIFDVSLDYLISGEESKSENKEENSETKEIVKETVKETVVVNRVPLYTCARCKKLLYEGDKVYKDKIKHSVRHGPHHHITYEDVVICENCHKEDIKQQVKEEKERDRHNKVDAKKRRICSFVFGGILAALFVLLGVYIALEVNLGAGILIAIVLAIMGFTYLSCLVMWNNLVCKIFVNVLELSFIKTPGVIFSLDFDGVAFLIAVKILFFIIGMTVMVGVFLLAFLLGGIVSLFVYPIALIRNIKQPELTGENIF